MNEVELQPSPPGKAAGLQEGIGGGKTQRRLTREERDRLLGALIVGAARDDGYKRIWKMVTMDGLNVSLRTVEYWYSKMYPERVKRRGTYPARELRIKLYEKVLELRRQGLGYKRIRKKLKELYCVAPSLAVISHWCRGIRSPYRGVRIPTIDHLKPSPELAYIIGAALGDGTVCKNSKGEYIFSLRVKDGGFAEEFARCLGQVLGRSQPRLMTIPDGRLLVFIRSKVLYWLLKKPIDFRRLRRFVEYSKECTANFLKGFF